MIFHHISQNLLQLREQLTFIEDEDIQAMHDAVYTKYNMLKYVKQLNSSIPISILNSIAIEEKKNHM